MIKIILLGNPYSTNSLYRHARGISYMSLKGRELKKSYTEQAIAQYKRDEPLESNLQVEIHLYFGDKRKRDWDNYHKLSMDALSGVVWIDDSQIQKTTVEKHRDIDNPRIELTISKYK